MKKSTQEENKKPTAKRNSNPDTKHSNTKMLVFEGILDMNKHGYGFVIIEARPGDDIIVRNNHLNTAINKDTVLVQVTNESKNKTEGKIIKVVKRANEFFTGIAHVKKDFAFVLPDKKYGMTNDIFIPAKGLKNVKDADKVIVKITDWEGGKNPIGRVEEILSGSSVKEIMWKTILMDHGFPLDFPKDVLEESENISTEITKDEIAKRRDFRNITTFTIDPETAKDFDDALSYLKLENGNYEIGIHIADVSHYLIPESALDKFAFEKATSVYLVDGTLPMLPEKLSNELCSLKPNEDKLCFSAVFEMDEQGIIHNEWFGKTVIHSDKRFTYEEAQEVIEKQEGLFCDELLMLNKIAHVIRKKRFKEGSINFDTVEPKFQLDAEGHPIGIIIKERKDAHLLIEDYMLLANKHVAKLMSKETTKGMPVAFPYRIHDLPDLEKLKSFNDFAKQFGRRINITTPKKIAESFNTMMEELKGKPEESILTSLAIRCMAKAIYSTKNIGHYGLGFVDYAHFTSPIRRYPDVLVHRILFEKLTHSTYIYQDRMDELCKHCSAQERKATESERESIKYKQAEFLKTQVGQIKKGIISGVTSFGVFVQLTDSLCEGMVVLRSMDEPYDYDEKALTVTAKFTGKKYTLGDTVNVVIKGANPEKKEVDLMFVE
ncbi:MAG: Ribonuclease [Bacteroidota bacterium]